MKDKLIKFKEIFGFDMPVDPLLFDTVGLIYIDLFELEKHIPNYNGKECTYKDMKDVSIEMAVKEEYGQEAVQFIKDLLK